MISSGFVRLLGLSPLISDWATGFVGAGDSGMFEVGLAWSDRLHGGHLKVFAPIDSAFRGSWSLRGPVVRGARDLEASAGGRNRDFVCTGCPQEQFSSGQQGVPCRKLGSYNVLR